MEFFRKVVNSDLLDDSFHIPPSLRHRQIELIVLPFGQNTIKVNARARVKAVRGALRKYANPLLRKQEKVAWAKAASDKYANR
jgi:hypothetical protein